MSPNQAAFEALGFIFTDIGDDVLFEATLPKGWSKQETTGSTILWENLLDEKGRKRGDYCYTGSFYDRYGHMNLRSRFHITYRHTEPDNWDSPVDVIVIDADDSVIFKAGQCKELYSEEYVKLVKKQKNIWHLTILSGKMLQNIGTN